MKVNKNKIFGIVLINAMLLVSGLGVTSATAQTTQEDPITWGVKGGVTVADFYGDAINDSEMKAGFSAGLFLNYRINEYFAIQPEVLYSQTSTKLATSLVGTKNANITEYEYDLSYLMVPVLAKFYIPTNSIVTPNIFVGPQVGFLLQGDENDAEIDNKLQDVTFGLAFGVGADFDVASSPSSIVQAVGIDARYTLGLTDTFANSDARNGAFVGSLVIGF